MGIKGLTGFVEQHLDELTSTFQLSNCTCVIDGKNFFYHLLGRSNDINRSFGGDYDCFGEVLRTVITNLKLCHIQPLIVFDGAFEDKKMETVLNRFQKSIMACTNVRSATQPVMQMYPLLLKLVISEVLETESVPFVKCIFEADNEVILLARYLNCPVLSNDSDFFVSGVPSVIPFWGIDLFVVDHQNTPCSISCTSIQIEKFLRFSQRNPISFELLPFLQILLGNDYVKSDAFEEFFSSILAGKKSEDSYTTELVRKIIPLLAWLTGKTYDSALAEVLKLVNKSYQKQTKNLFRDTKSVADRCSPSQYILFQLGISTSSDGLEDQTVTLNLPKWFLKLYVTSRSPAMFMGISDRAHFLLKCLVEQSNMSCTFEPILPVIHHICSLLQPTKQVTFFMRQNRSYVKKCFIPSHNVKNYGPLPTFNQLPDIDRNECKKLLLAICVLSSEDEKGIALFPDVLQTYVLGLIYWKRNTKCQLADSIFSSLIYCILIMYPKWKRKCQCECTKQQTTSLLLDQLSDGSVIEERCLVEDILSQVMNNDRMYHGTFVHVMCEFQTCFYIIYYLNLLLGNIYTQCQHMQYFFKGSYIYCVSLVFHNCQQYKNWYRKLLHENMEITKAFDEIQGKLKFINTKKNTKKQKTEKPKAKEVKLGTNKFSALLSFTNKE